MGRLKQLLPLDGKPLIRHCIDSIIAAGIGDVVVVLGIGDELSKVLDGLPVRIAFNKKSKTDMAESVRSGLCAIDHISSGVMVSLSDHPLVSAETFKSLIDRHFEDPGKIIVPLYDKRKGHPVLFPRNIITEIFASTTLRDIVNKYPDRTQLFEVHDEGVITDIDTIGDYERAVKKYAAFS
ncbi:MAG: NTP transferase domain-containing protein [Dissulfurispiraceae bacterium]